MHLKRVVKRKARNRGFNERFKICCLREIPLIFPAQTAVLAYSGRYRIFWPIAILLSALRCLCVCVLFFFFFLFFSYGFAHNWICCARCFPAIEKHLGFSVLPKDTLTHGEARDWAASTLWLVDSLLYKLSQSRPQCLYSVICRTARNNEKRKQKVWLQSDLFVHGVWFSSAWESVKMQNDIQRYEMLGPNSKNETNCELMSLVFWCCPCVTISKYMKHERWTDHPREITKC